jgi:hypothetical protein
MKLLVPMAKLEKQWFCTVEERVDARVEAGENCYGDAGKVLI